MATGNKGLVNDQAKKALALVTKVLEFGPKTPEFTGHVQAGVEEFVAAKDMVVTHFGLAAGPQGVLLELEDAYVACPELKVKVEELQAKTGHSGKFLDTLKLLLSNPALLTLVMSMFGL